MGETTAIEWTHHSWSPWFGCTKVHTGCSNCYSEADNARYKRNGSGRFGPGQPRVVRKNWDDPLKWARQAARAGERWKVFPSLCDPLDEEAPPGAPERLWQLIRATARRCAACDTALLPDEPQCPGRKSTPNRHADRLGGLDWLPLTKRPERWREVPEDVRPLVWLGTSISDQATADEWVPRLLGTEGFRLRFLSVEPLVGPVDLTAALSVFDRHGEPSGPRVNKDGSDAIGWVIVGGESGPGARWCDVAWIRSVVQQCRAAGVPCFVKQLGTRPLNAAPDLSGRPESLKELVGIMGGLPLVLRDPKGGDISEFPPDLRVRQFPEVRT